MKLRSNKLGMTAVEMVLTMSILSLLSIGLLTMLMQGLRGWGKGAGNEVANSAATVGLQRLSYEIRDGRTAMANVYGTRLTVVFPLALTDSLSHETIFDAYANDPTPRTYYVDTSGNLVRNVGGVVTVMARKVTRVAFFVSANAVDITVESIQQLGSEPCTQQARGRLTLRNYR